MLYASIYILYVLFVADMLLTFALINAQVTCVNTIVA